jgi:hypothetical protein
LLITLRNFFSDGLNQMLRYSDKRQKRPKGLEMFFVTPLILGGSPNADSITYLDRKQHIEATRYWNRIIYDLRRKQMKE